jgi:hypothetical protein
MDGEYVGLRRQQAYSLSLKGRRRIYTVIFSFPDSGKEYYSLKDNIFVQIIKIIRYVPHTYYTYFIVFKQIINSYVTIHSSLYMKISNGHCSSLHFGVMVLPASSEVLYFSSYSTCLQRCSHNVAPCTGGSLRIYCSWIYSYVLRKELLLCFLNKTCK